MSAGRVVYKYSLSSFSATFDFPPGARVLAVQVQHGDPVMWVEHSTDQSKLEPRRFVVIGTGHPFPEDFRGTYVATFQLDGGSFIGHVYETPVGEA